MYAYVSIGTSPCTWWRFQGFGIRLLATVYFDIHPAFLTKVHAEQDLKALLHEGGAACQKRTSCQGEL